MVKAPLYSKNGELTGEVELPEWIFGVEPNSYVVHQYVVAHLARRRHGTASAKTRGDVHGGGRKPWRQKGTGRARAGSRSSPIWRHGGVVFPPKPHSFRKRMPKKMRRIAMFSVLSDRAAAEAVAVIEPFELDAPSTKKMYTLLNSIDFTKGRKTLLITAGSEPTLYLSARNIPNVSITHTGELNPYQLIVSDRVLFTKDAISRIEELWKQ